MDKLVITSCQAANADPVIAEVVGYLGRRLGRAVTFENQIPWQDRYRLLDEGAIPVGWICGWPYVRRADAPGARLELLAAPVMAGARYQDRPVYFSDVVVRRDSPFQRFADLRGTRWAINEPGSHSGYNVVRWHLATLGESWSFFESVVASGGHQRSLQLIRAREIDASAIDSTVFETELEKDPALADEVRVIGSLGPSPIPPWVVDCRLPPALRAELRAALLGMHTDPAGQAILAQGRMRRFAAVTDADYDPIREMTRLAAHLAL